MENKKWVVYTVNLIFLADLVNGEKQHKWMIWMKRCLWMYNEMVNNPAAASFIKEMKQDYDEKTQKIKTNLMDYLEEYKNNEISSERLVYDVVVGKVICDFWIKVMEQPRETIKQYYKDNFPGVENTFRQCELDYNLTEFCTADTMISSYKYYT